MTSDGTNTYVWDRANRLLSMGGIAYAYDGLGNRVSQTANSIVTAYLNDVQPGLTKVLAQTVGSDVTRFVHGPRGIQALEDGAGWTYPVQDGLGSVRDDALSYSPYGVPNDAITGFAFTGEQRDANGLQYHRARYYAPELGVWASLDPVENINRYDYVDNNPTNTNDPSGLIAEVVPPTCDNLTAFIGTPYGWPTNANSMIPSSDDGKLVQSDICLNPNVSYEDKLSAGCYSNHLVEEECVTQCSHVFQLRYGAHAYRACMSLCLKQKADDAGECQIEVYSYNTNYLNALPSIEGDIAILAPFQPNHSFIMVWDDSNKTTGTAYAATPAGSPLQGATLFAFSQPHDQPGGQYVTWLEYGGGGPQLLLGGREACAKKECLQRQVNRITATQTPYNPLGLNSNTATRSLLESCGIPTFEPGFPLWLGQSLPGWENDTLVE